MAASRHGWPRRYVDLILQATFLPRAEARAAFEQWTAERDFDAISWEEMRLLVPLSRRKDADVIRSPVRPRVIGVSRYLWARTQVRIARSVGAIDSLSEVGVDALLFKGAALHADGLGIEAGRVFSDLDILVRPRDFHRALDRLFADGWKASTGRSNAETRRLAAVRAGVNLSLGREGEIDLHSHMFHYARRDASADEELWARTRTGTLAGRPVRAPDPEHALLAQLAHSCYSEAGDWAVECFARSTRQSVEWPRLIDLADRRGLLPIVDRRLSYLVEALRFDLPDDARAALAARPRRMLERLKAYSLLAPREGRRPLDRAVGLLADLALPKSLYTIERKQNARAKFVRPTPIGRLLRGAGPVGAVSPALAAQEAIVRFDADPRAKLLFLDLEIAHHPARRKVLFDVRLDDATLAILKARLPHSKIEKKRILSFRLRLPDSAPHGAPIKIVSLLNHPVSADSSQFHRLRNDAVAFVVRQAALSR